MELLLGTMRFMIIASICILAYAFLSLQEDIEKDLKMQNVKLDMIEKIMYAPQSSHLQRMLADVKAIREQQEKVYV